MDEKIEAVLSYLKAEFPEAKITRPSKGERNFGFDYDAEAFRIDTGPARHLLGVANNFLDDNSPSTIANVLKGREVSRELRRSGDTPLLLSSEALHLI